MRALLSLALVVEAFTVSAQYFQQQVDYTIDVTLNTVDHTLHGQWQIVYHNHSPKALDRIVLHLYPNAYSAKNTAFARQMLRLGESEFHFSTPEERGSIDNLEFTTNNQRIPWRLDTEHPDIAILRLREDLPPGDSIVISSPFRIDIPKSFSRLGHIGDTYQLTQWYPKPAVYDQDGWHPLPYLNQGEFYGEFGSFDVRITLPANYLVAATGDLISKKEKQWLDSLVLEANPPLWSTPESAGTNRTWHFSAENVHDFAWFTDKRFAVRKEFVTVGDREVECWAFFTAFESELWEDATSYIHNAVEFYSSEIGDYPYPQMTAVQVPLGYDFGMEYPMITVINQAGDAKSLDDVITHEVGHNWFYGVLGTNERKHPWMDEGINTFYEYKYLRYKYTHWSEHLYLWKAPHPDGMSDEQRLMQKLSREKDLSPPDSDPEYATGLQNFFGSYFKPALAFDMLEEYLGEKPFRAAMQEYFREWKFRHPGPEDLRAILIKYCNCDLAWFFDGLLETAELIDYKILDAEGGNVTVENQGNIDAPIHLIAYQGDSILRQAWFPGSFETQALNFNTTGADKVQIYNETYTLDEDPFDNVLFIDNKNTKRSRLKVRMIGGKRQPGEQYLNVLPVPGYNYVDKAMIGLALSNTYWPTGDLQWGIVPFYATETKSLTGAGEIRYGKFPKDKPWKFEIGLAAKSFHFDRDTHYNFVNRYLKAAPHIALILPKNAEHRFQYRYVSVWQQYGQGIDYVNFEWEERTRRYDVHELLYHRTEHRNLANSKVTATAHLGKGFVRLAVDTRYDFIYLKDGKSVYLHGFAGALPHLENPDANVSFQFNGIQGGGIFSRDFLYDEILLSRNEAKGIASQLVFLKDAQVKTLYNGGLTEKWMIAGGIMLETPLPIPVMPYLDAVVYADPFDAGAALSYSAGLALVVQKDILEVYLPILESSDIRNSLTYETRDNIWRRISINVNLKAFHPFKFQGY